MITELTREYLCTNRRCAMKNCEFDFTYYKWASHGRVGGSDPPIVSRTRMGPLGSPLVSRTTATYDDILHSSWKCCTQPTHNAL